ncbi:hypothetical protein DID88_008356 [Monilinia fructigena]|uniref:RING-type domain-containing protein n=1 Tax=Monilinia fructigena TaxID=38457 RepID=A0A395J7H8_9HELO|nr:hypothetical protein DID88_008356 [Monilinia fructigena]
MNTDQETVPGIQTPRWRLGSLVAALLPQRAAKNQINPDVQVAGQRLAHPVTDTTYPRLSENGVSPDIQAAHQQRQNRLAAERGEAPPFPNFTSLNVSAQRFSNVPNLPFLVRQVRDNMEALAAGSWLLPWPEYANAGLRPNVIPELEQAIIRQIHQQGFLPHRNDQHLHIPWSMRAAEIVPNNACHPIPRDDVPDTPSWILAFFPDTQTIGQRNADDKPTCPICMEELPGMASIAKPCNHRFCTSCLDGWMAHLEGARQAARCPMCVTSLTRVGNNGELGFRIWGLLGRN